MTSKWSINRLVPIVGFLLLSAMVLTLLMFTLYEAWVLRSMGVGVVALVIVGVGVEMLHERRRVPCVLLPDTFRHETALTFGGVVVGALVAYVLSVDVGLGAVTASALVALVAALILPEHAVPIYCGSFVGMTSARLLISHGEVAIAGGIAATLYVLTACSYPGYGGKLGTIAFIGSVLTGWGLDREFLITEIPTQPVIWLIIAHAMIATVVTYWLSIRLEHGPVVASGIVGLIGGLVLPAVYSEIGETLAVMVICASFAGMSSAQRFPRFLWMLTAGLVTGLIFVYSMPLMGGAGGKLGTIAFSSVLAVNGWLSLIARLMPARSVNRLARQS